MSPRAVSHRHRRHDRNPTRRSRRRTSHPPPGEAPRVRGPSARRSGAPSPPPSRGAPTSQTTEAGFPSEAASASSYAGPSRAPGRSDGRGGSLPCRCQCRGAVAAPARRPSGAGAVAVAAERPVADPPSHRPGRTAELRTIPRVVGACVGSVAPAASPSKGEPSGPWLSTGRRESTELAPGPLGGRVGARLGDVVDAGAPVDRKRRGVGRGIGVHRRITQAVSCSVPGP